MKIILPVFVVIVALCGCAGGPTHDFYNPAIVGQKFKGPVTMEIVKDIAAEKERCVRDGYTVIGGTVYGGKFPEAVELRAQANRVHANHVIYSCVALPAQPGSWHFNLGGWGGNGGTDGGGYDVHIIFLGR